jgi:hypothetical protein
MRDVIIGALLIIIALLALDRSAAPEPMIEDVSLHHADFPACVTIRPAPLLRTPNGRVDYRLGKPSNDRGET